MKIIFILSITSIFNLAFALADQDGPVDFSQEPVYQCPFDIDMDTYVNPQIGQELRTLHAQIQAQSSGNSSCQIIGQQLQVLITQIDQTGTRRTGGGGIDPFPTIVNPSIDPSTIGTNGGKDDPPSAGTAPQAQMQAGGQSLALSPSVSQPDGEEVATGCYGNPVLCAQAIQTIMAEINNGGCGNLGSAITQNLVSIASTASTVTGQPWIAASAVGVGLVHDFIQFIRGRRGSERIFDNFTEAQVEALELNLEAIAACGANEAYFDSICSTEYLTKINEDMSKSGGNECNRRCEIRKARAFYSCLYIDIENRTEHGANLVSHCESEAGITSDQVRSLYASVIDEDSATLDFLGETQMQTLLRTAENFHTRQIAEVGNILNDLREQELGEDGDGYYPTSSYHEQLRLLIGHCFEGYIPLHVQGERSRNYREPDVNSTYGSACSAISSCIDQINGAQNTDFISFSHFRPTGDGNRIRGMCHGGQRLIDRDDEYMLNLVTQLTNARFRMNKNGRGLRSDRFELANCEPDNPESPQNGGEFNPFATGAPGDASQN